MGEQLDRIEAKIDKLLAQTKPEPPNAYDEPATTDSMAFRSGAAGSAELVDTVPAPPVRMTWRTAGMAYRAHYLKAKAGQVLDFHIQTRQRDFEELALEADCYANPERELEQALTTFFADEWAAAHGFPVRALVKSFGKYHSPVVIQRKDEPDPEAINARRLQERREQEDRELRRKLESHARDAAPPPPLDELISKVGRKL